MLLLLLAVVVPLLDIFLLVKLAGTVGIVPTVLLTVFTGIVGIGIVRREGMAVLLRLQTAVMAQEAGQAVVEGALLTVGGILLLTPGLVTDVLGFALVLPWTRVRLARYLRERAEASPNVHVQVHGF